MSLLSFRIRYPDGRQESLAVDADRALIGSGAHCEIRLPSDSARVEHVSIQVTPTGLYAQALSFDPPPMVNGIQFTQGNITSDTILVVGNAEISVSTEQASTEVNKVVRQSQQKTSPMMVFMVLAMIPLLGFVIFNNKQDTGPPPPPKAVPALWEGGPPPCPKTDHDGALSIATDKNAAAETRRERSPFDVRDGIAAVPLFDLAAACFKVAGDPKASDEARKSADDLRKRFEEDYHTHVVWLEHSLNVQDWRSAQREVTLLLAFTNNKKGDYVAWLGEMDRQLRIKYGAREK